MCRMKPKRFNKSKNYFDKTFLNNLKDDDLACVEVVRKTEHLALHPFHLQNLNESVKELLNKGLNRLNKNLNGILLGYENVRLVSNVADVVTDTCFIHLDVEGDFYVFKPEVGKELKGVVNKISADHVGCLVHNMFNVSLPRPEQNEDWIGEKLQIGSEVRLRITFMRLEHRLPYIKGEIISVLTESDSGISSEDVSDNKKSFKIKHEDEEVVSKPKKKRKIKQEPIEEEYEVHPEEQEEQPVKKKKKKKHREQEISHDDFEEPVQEHKKKKKKKDKQKTQDESFEDTRIEKKIKKEQSVSLDDLRLTQLFAENEVDVNKVKGHEYMADFEDKATKRKRKSSTSMQISWENKEIKLPPDSDLEEVLKEDKKKKKRKRSGHDDSHEFSLKKVKIEVESD